MARVRDLWYSKIPVLNEDGTKKRDEHGRVVYELVKSSRHPDNGGSKAAKRYQACWYVDGKEQTEGFYTKAPAEKYAKKMEGDADRGEYIDPEASKALFGPLAEKHMRLRKKKDGKRPGASAQQSDASVYKNHVKPRFAHRKVGEIKASEIAEWLDDPSFSEMSIGIRQPAFAIVVGAFDMAVDDRLRRDNPARAKSVHPPRADPERRKKWPMETVLQIRDRLPEEFRVTADLGAGLGLRRGEMFGLSPDDFDWDEEKVTIARQSRKVGRNVTFKLPKGNKERTVPLPRGTALAVKAHMDKFPPVSVTLPWEDEEGNLGDPVTVRLLLTWPREGHWKLAGQSLAAGDFEHGVWKPALAGLGLIPPPKRDKWHRLRYLAGESRHQGMHAMRHVYEGMLGDGGVSLAGQMSFMGHSPKGQVVTIGVYGSVTSETFERGRDAVDKRLYRLRPVGGKNRAAGTGTGFRVSG